MADITQIQLAGGATYDIKDATSRTNAEKANTQEEYDRQLAANVYAGRNIANIPELASEISSAGSVIAFLHARASAGNFANLRPGDYFECAVTGYGTKRFDIFGFNPFKSVGDSGSGMGNHIGFIAHQPVAIPSTSEYVTNGSYLMWNTTNTNQGTEEEPAPYLCSNLHAWEINEFLPALPSALQSVLINRRDLVETRYSASGNLTASTGWKWADLGKVWSPSEMELYGCNVWGTPGYSQGIGQQMQLFRECKDRLRGGRVNWWLRVVSGSSASNACYVSSRGLAYNSSATDTWVRPLPCFLLG